MPEPSPVIHLREKGATAQIAPALGGAILNFDMDGRHVLRPAAANIDHPLQAAHFALAPYANRIGNGRFRFGEQDVVLAANTGLSRHPLHGQAWLRPWQIEDSGSAWARLIYRHAPDEWPWRYRVEQTVTLSQAGLSIALTLCNEDSMPMPGGLGFHPYFPRGSGTRLQTGIGGVWLTDEESLPISFQAAGTHHWPKGVDLSEIGTLVDHCHEAWDGAARLWTDNGVTDMVADPACSRLHIYVPPGETFLCLEPVTNRPDPFCGDALANGMVILAPGDKLHAQMRIGFEFLP